jgi:hypothetical protein
VTSFIARVQKGSGAYPHPPARLRGVLLNYSTGTNLPFILLLYLPTQSPIKWAWGGGRGSYPEGKAVWSVADLSLPSTAVVKNAWSYTSILTTRLHGVTLSWARGNFTLLYRYSLQSEISKYPLNSPRISYILCIITTCFPKYQYPTPS